MVFTGWNSNFWNKFFERFRVKIRQKKFTQGQILTAEETKKLQKVKNFDLSKVIQVKVKTQLNTPDRIGIKNETSNFVEIQPKPNQKVTPNPTQLSKSSLMSLIESQKYDQRKTNKELRKLAPDSQEIVWFLYLFEARTPLSRMISVKILAYPLDILIQTGYKARWDWE